MDPFKGSTHLSREPEMWTISHSLRRIAIPIALVTLHSCIHDSSNSSGSTGAGAGQSTTFGNEDLTGTWVLKVYWDNPDKDRRNPTLLLFGDSILGESPPLVNWTDDLGTSFLDRILATEVALAKDGDFIFWAHYLIPDTDLLGTFLLAGKMTTEKLSITGRGNDHGASGDPEGVTNAWDCDFYWSLEAF